MASSAHRFDDAEVACPVIPGRLYTACFFDQGLVVPRVHLFEATTDEHAIRKVRSSQALTKREIWDQNRLVAVIPPDTGEMETLVIGLEHCDASKPQG